MIFPIGLLDLVQSARVSPWLLSMPSVTQHFLDLLINWVTFLFQLKLFSFPSWSWLSFTGSPVGCLLHSASPRLRQQPAHVEFLPIVTIPWHLWSGILNYHDKNLGGNNPYISFSTLSPRISFDLYVTVQSPCISKVFFFYSSFSRPWVTG